LTTVYLSVATGNTLGVAVPATDVYFFGAYPVTTISTSVPPTITFPNFTATYGNSPKNLTLYYTSNSDGAVTYTSSDTLVATISGSTITFVGVGPSTITATQEATATYSSAITPATCAVAANTPSNPVGITNREELEYFLSTNATYGQITVANITITSTLLANSNKVLTSLRPEGLLPATLTKLYLG
jgi:hypothetical protein